MRREVRREVIALLRVLFALALVMVARNAYASCDPGTLRPGTKTCECPNGYDFQIVAAEPRCVKRASDPKAATTTTSALSTSACTDLDDCKKKCDANAYPACAALGLMYRTGKGVSLADPAKAYDYFRKACDGDDLSGCVEQGRMLEAGVGTTKDAVAANKAFAKACDGKNTLGCRELAGNYFNGTGVTKDLAKALELFEKACAGRDAASCTNAGYLLVNGLAAPADRARALKLFIEGCDLGDKIGCFNAALVLKGEDGKSEPAKVLLYLEKACALNHAEACTDLGYRYEKGLGIASPDDAKAYTVWEKGCGLNDAEACYLAGFALFHGHGVAKNEKLAGVRLDKGCKGKEYGACTLLGTMYVEGRGVTKDEAKGAKLVKSGCEDEIGQACLIYGKLLLTGRGVKKDVSAALKFGELSCELDPGETCHWTGSHVLKTKPVVRSRARELFKQGCAAKHEPSCKEGKRLDDLEAAEKKAIEDEKKRRLAPAWIVLPGLDVKIQMAGGADFVASTTTSYRKRPVTVVERKKDTGTPFRISIVRETISCKGMKEIPEREEAEDNAPYLPEDAKLRAFYHPITFEGFAADDRDYAFVCADLKDGSAFHLTFAYDGNPTEDEFVTTTHSFLSSFAKAMTDYPPGQFELLDDTGRERTWKSYLLRANIELGGSYFDPRTPDQKAFGLLVTTGSMFFSSALPKKVGIGVVGGFSGSLMTILGVNFDTHVAGGLGLKAGPLHIAPLLGGGIDTAFVISNQFKVPFAPYYSYGGDVRLRFGLGSVGGSLMFARRADDVMLGEKRYSVNFSYRTVSVTGQYWSYETPNAAHVPHAYMLTIGTRHNTF